MKTIVTFFILSIASPVYAADEWSRADLERESAYMVLHTIDWRQTRYGTKHPEQFAENNPILGKYPSLKRVDTYFAATALLHVGAVHLMPEKWRPAFQYFWIVVEAGYVANNYRIGVKVDL